MLIGQIYKTVTTVGGTASFNTVDLSGELSQFIVTPTTGTTKWDCKVVGERNEQLFYRTGKTGEYNELTKIPVQGIYTFTILNATADEQFTVYLSLVNRY